MFCIQKFQEANVFYNLSHAQCPSRQNKDMTNAQTIKIAVPFIRRKLGIKNVDKKRIEVFRTPDHRYIISYRGTGYQLNRKED